MEFHSELLDSCLYNLYPTGKDIQPDTVSIHVEMVFLLRSAPIEGTDCD